MRGAALLSILTPLLLMSCASVPDAPAAQHPEAAIYDPALDASAALDAALVKAGTEGKLVLLALGGNWCHDSRAFAGWMQDARFESFIEANFVPVFINVGLPQTGDGFNLHIARRFGIDEIEGTPTVLIITPDGAPLNADSAQDWRNSSTRSPEEIRTELAGFLVGYAQ